MSLAPGGNTSNCNRIGVFFAGFIQFNNPVLHRIAPASLHHVVLFIILIVVLPLDKTDRQYRACERDVIDRRQVESEANPQTKGHPRCIQCRALRPRIAPTVALRMRLHLPGALPRSVFRNGDVLPKRPDWKAAGTCARRV